MTNDLSRTALKAVAEAGEKGIDSLLLLNKFPDETNASDIHFAVQKLRNEGLIRFDVKYRRIPHGGGKECIQRCIATETGKAHLAQLEGGGE